MDRSPTRLREVRGRFDSLEARVRHIPSYRRTFEQSLALGEGKARFAFARLCFTDRLQAFSAEYSLGASRAELATVVPELATYAAAAWRWAVEEMPEKQLAAFYKFGRDIMLYREWLWLISLGLALDVDDATFDEIVFATTPVHDDKVIGQLIQSRRPDFVVKDELAFKTLGRGLDAAWAAKDPVDALLKFLAKWPAGYYKRELWIDSHLSTDPRNQRYFGYWAVEVAGVVKALNLNDTRLLENEYYPAGILHADR